MAVSGTSSSNSTASIDVTSIVSQLMVSENKPLVALKDKITSKNLLISDLGTIKSKVASFQTALKSLQTPGDLAASVATSSDESVVTITSSTGAINGQHNIVVNKVAQPAKITFNGFDSATANAGLSEGGSFSITIGTTTHTYEPAEDVTMADTTIQDLSDWANALGVSVRANIVKTSGNNYALMIQGTEPGSDHAITYSNTPASTIETSLDKPITGTGADPSEDLAGFVAGDIFTLDFDGGEAAGGKTYTNSSFTNSTTIGDVKAWIDIVSTSSIDESNELVLSNGATYSIIPSAGPVRTTITGNPSDLAGFTEGDIFTLDLNDGSAPLITDTFTSLTTIDDVRSWVASQLPVSSINGSKELVLTDADATYTHAIFGLGSPLKRPVVVSAQDAAFTLDGIDYTRTSNTVTDVLSGITINLIKSDTTSQSISVSKGADKTPEVIQGLVDSYNDLVATAKKLSAKSSPSSTASTDGSLANSPTALSFLSQIKAMLVGDIHYSLAGTDGTLSLGDLGFEMQFDGTVKFNQTTLNGTKNASAILASGIQVGYATYVERDPDTGEIVSKVTTDVTLDSYLNSLLKATKSDDGAIAGAFDRMIANERSSLSEMNKKQTSLQIRLDEKQKSLYSQYSALNALLFKLSNTSNSLTNALSGLTNGQNNN